MDEVQLEQYRQVWEQRRRHVGLYWKIPTVATLFIGLLIQTPFFKSLVSWKYHVFTTFLTLYTWGVVRLFLRHNFFQEAYGILLQDMEDRMTNPLRPLPQFGRELKNLYETRLGFWARLGLNLDGSISWFLLMLSACLTIIFIWLDVTNLPSSICHVCNS